MCARPVLFSIVYHAAAVRVTTIIMHRTATATAELMAAVMTAGTAVRHPNAL